MSLIPSESLNFPDSFRANVGWRLTDADETEVTGSSPERAGIPNPFPPQVAPPKIVAEPPAPAPLTSAGPFSPPVSNEASSSPSAEPQTEADDRQMELIPKTATDQKPTDSSPGPVEMSALLKYFLAAGATTTVVADHPNGETAVRAKDPAPESPTILNSPNEPPIIPPVKVELATASPPEQKRESEIANDISSPQQSIVAALESLSHADVEAPIGRVDIQTPAQANHVLELIAAAVQRGALVGQTVTEQAALEPTTAATASTPEPSASGSGFAIAPDPLSESSETPPSRESTPSFSIPAAAIPEPSANIPEPPATVPDAPAIAPAPLPADEPSRSAVSGPTTAVSDFHPAPVPASPAVSVPSSTPGAPKVPAKIRITPRKIKPRPQVQPMPDEQVTSPPTGHDLPADVSPEAKGQTMERVPRAPFPLEKKPVPKSLESPEPLMPRAELSARKIAAARSEHAQSDLFMFNARERRNRWIGFGLSELAVVTALILLGRFGFTHPFPDPTLKVLVFILIFAAAAVAIALPIAFFRNDPQRWGRVDR